MINNLSKVYSPIIKKFLFENFGLDNMCAFTIIDGETIGFGIRQLRFFVDCKTMSIKRQIDNVSDNGIYITTALNDDIVMILEKNLKIYVNSKIEEQLGESK